VSHTCISASVIDVTNHKHSKPLGLVSYAPVCVLDKISYATPKVAKVHGRLPFDAAGKSPELHQGLAVIAVRIWSGLLLNRSRPIVLGR
jgi:hypothetical protein